MNDTNISSKHEFNKKYILKVLIIGTAMNLVVFLFSTCFGKHNLVIGVTFCMSIFALSRKDFVIKTFNKTICLMLLYLSLGIIAYVSSKNVYTGIFINFLTIFLLCFLLVSDFETSSYYPFLMLYVYMIFIPVNFKELPLRIVALIVCSILVVAFKLLLFKKSTPNKFDDLISLVNILINILESILDSTYDKKNISEFSNKIETINDNIFQKERDKNFYITVGGRLMLNVSFSLERISMMCQDMYEHYKLDNYAHDFIRDLISQLKNIILLLQKSSEVPKFNASIKKFVKKYNKSPNKYYYIYEILEIMVFLRRNLYKLQGLNIKSFNILDENYTRPKEFSFIEKLKERFSVNSLSFTFAFRMALALSITIFVSSFVKEPKIMWISVTVFVLIQPYFEDTLTVSLGKIIGTLGGCLIFMLILTFIHSYTLRLILVIISMYLYVGINNFNKKMIFATVLTIGIACLNSGNEMILVDRLVFILIATVIALLANRFIFPYKKKDDSLKLATRYLNIDREMLQEVIKLYSKDPPDDEVFRNLILECNEIDGKLTLNNISENNNYIEDFNYTQRFLVNDLAYIFIKIYDVKKRNPDFQRLYENLLKFLNLVLNKKPANDELYEVRQNLKDLFLKSTTPLEKSLILNTGKLLIQIQKLETPLISLKGIDASN